MDVKQYLPEFYEKDYGRTNTPVLTADVLSQILQDTESEPFNNWDDRTSLEKELHIKELIVSGFKIRDTNFLKAFFAFKGTNLDLQYILKTIGYDSVIYNDGGYVHRGLDGKDRVIPINPFYKETISEPRCQIEIKVILDLNLDESFEGYFGLDLNRIRQICNERLNSCSYLSRVFIEAMARERYETMKWTQDYLIIKRNLEIFKDNYFTEYRLPEVIYGEEFNDQLKYGKEYNDMLAYGRHNQVYFRPLWDKLVVGATVALPEVAMSLNGGEGGTIQATEFVDIRVTKPQYDTYQFGFRDHMDYISRRKLYFTDEKPYPVLEAQDSIDVGYGRNVTFIEHPASPYYYGREHNVDMKYGVARDSSEFGNKSNTVASYGEVAKNQGTEHPALSLNGDNPDAVVQLQDAVEITVTRRGG